MNDDDAQALLTLLTTGSPCERVGAAIGVAKTVADHAGLSRSQFVRLCAALWDRIDQMNAQMDSAGVQ